MESQKIIYLLDLKDEDDPRFETRNWYIVHAPNNGNYSQGDDVQSIDHWVKIFTKFFDYYIKNGITKNYIPFRP